MAWSFDIGNMLGGLFGSVGSAMGSMLSYKQQKKLMERQAQIQYDNQRSLNQNAYQDTVSSMRNAGINPMLAIGNGASGGSAGMPSASSQPVDLDPTTAYATLKQVKNDTELKDSQKKLNSSQERLNTYSADKAHEESAYVNEQNRQLMEFGPLIKQAQLDGILTNTAKSIQDIENSKRITDSQVNLNASSAKANYANAQSHPFKVISDKFINPFTNSSTYKKFMKYGRWIDSSLSRLLP